MNLRYFGMTLRGLFAALALIAAGHGSTQADGTSLSFTPQSQPIVKFDPIPAAMEYQINFAADLTQGFALRTDGTLGVYTWTSPQSVVDDFGFYRVTAKVLPPDRIAAYNLLNRIAYGPTPDDLERVLRMGPDAYLTEQLAADGLSDETDNPGAAATGWQKFTATGTGSSSRLYIYLDGQGDAYLDDLRLVAGSTDNGTGVNLIRNGGFESALTGIWITSATTTNSVRTAVQNHTGTASLHVIDTAAGSDKTKDTSIYQDITPALSSSQTYTLSFWHYASPTVRPPILRLSGSGIVANTADPGSIKNKRAALDAGTASISVLQGWHVQRAVQSPRQLNEVLRQFLENHFVTEYSKTSDYLDGKLPNALVSGPATRTEYHENQLWAQALLNPDVTFHDLLKISAESPAMIVYLDTVNSAGSVVNGKVTKIANENYARELLELFCFGVDNGYEQQDIVQLSRVWTGWSVELTAPGQETNPLAAKSTVYIDPSLTGTALGSYTNLQGQWAFKFKSANHYTGPKYLFADKNANGTLATNRSKTLPARFGPPWAGRPYQLNLPTRTGNAGLQDGYEVLAHLANLPFTEEFLCVKLCRIFVHDDFHLGYDFTDDVTTSEEDLVHRMMLAWETPPNGGRKGQLRPVLKVLFDSALFRSSLTSSQKVKTPLEYAVSAIRALRATRGDGGFTADTDGTSLAITSGTPGVINRAGRMNLFNRAEPDGYPESAPGWISAGTLAERLRFVQAALIAPGATGHADAGALTYTDPVGLLQVKGIPINDSAAVTDYLLGILYPSEGAANLAEYRALAIRFLDTADNGTTTSLLSSLSATARDTRIRGVVSALMTTARFQEQ